MNSTDLLLLVKAGYTRAEIEAMDAPAPAAADPAPEPPAPVTDPAPAPAAPAPAPAPVIPTAPTPAPAPQPQTAPGMSEDAKAILDSLSNVLKGVAIPQPGLSIDEKMANTLKMALGVPVETPKK